MITFLFSFLVGLLGQAKRDPGHINLSGECIAG